MKNLYLISLLCVFLLSGCGTMRMSYKDKVLLVQKGTTKEEVLELFGRPDFRRFDDVYEEWEYRYTTNLLYTGEDFIIIRFIGNVVQGLDSYNVPPPPKIVQEYTK